jgi:hypothetical protein
VQQCVSLTSQICLPLYTSKSTLKAHRIKKSWLAYEILDDNNNILFLRYMFTECIRDFVTDEKCARQYPVRELEQRLEFFQSLIPGGLPSTIVSRLQEAISFIRRNQDTYFSIHAVL